MSLNLEREKNKRVVWRAVDIQDAKFLLMNSGFDKHKLPIIALETAEQFKKKSPLE